MRASAQGECQCEIFLVSTSSTHNNKGGCSRDAQGSADLPQCRRGAVSPSSISGLIHFAHDRKQDSANTRAYSYEHTQSKRRLFVHSGDNSIASYTYSKMLSTIHYEFIRAFYYAIIRLLPHRVYSRSVQIISHLIVSHVSPSEILVDLDIASCTSLIFPSRNTVLFIDISPPV